MISEDEKVWDRFGSDQDVPCLEVSVQDSPHFFRASIGKQNGIEDFKELSNSKLSEKTYDRPRIDSENLTCFGHLDAGVQQHSTPSYMDDQNSSGTNDSPPLRPKKELLDHESNDSVKIMTQLPRSRDISQQYCGKSSYRSSKLNRSGSCDSQPVFRQIANQG